jgi:hypothetical protein
MSDYQLRMTLDAVEECAPQLRVWIDDQLAGDLSSEKEIPLVRETETSWCARFSTEGEAFMYRIGIYALSGSRWSLSFRGAGRDGEELLFDSDELTMPKEWLVGTCDVLLLGSSHRNVRSTEAPGALS